MEIQLISKNGQLNLNVNIDKIINAADIDDVKYTDLYEKVLTNKATETEKFSIQKYTFKKFWNFKVVDKTKS
jgi:hypothetical protein